MRPKIVLASGCFDPFHYGHLLHLQAAKKLGDILIVSVTRDEFVNKGEGRPVLPDYKRAATLAALRCVDAVMLTNSSYDALMLVKPDIFVKGAEYRNRIDGADKVLCEKIIGIEIAFTDEETHSSTELLRHYESRRG